MGGSGRLARMLRGFWKDRPVSWLSRAGGAGLIANDPLNDPRGLSRAAMGQGAVLCLAGIVSNTADLSANTDLALAGIRAAAEAGGIPVLLSSSAAVYGRGDRSWTEQDITRPESRYGQAKLRMEDHALALGEKLSVPVCNLRIGNVAGADTFLAGWRQPFGLHQFADGTTLRRSYIGPRALSDALADLLARGRQLPNRLNLALPGAVDVGELMACADLAWTPVVAPHTAIPKVEMDVALLNRFHSFAPGAGEPSAIIGDWRRWKETGETP